MRQIAENICMTFASLYFIGGITTFSVLYASNIYNSKYVYKEFQMFPINPVLPVSTNIPLYICNMCTYSWLVFGGMIIKSLWLASIFPITWYDIRNDYKHKGFYQKYFIPYHKYSPQYIKFKKPIYDKIFRTTSIKRDR